MIYNNQLYTDLQNFDLGAHIEKYGQPHWTTKRNPVGQLNEDFWAALEAELNHILFEKGRKSFTSTIPGSINGSARTCFCAKSRMISCAPQIPGRGITRSPSCATPSTLRAF